MAFRQAALRTESSNPPSTALILSQILAFLWSLVVGPLAFLLLGVAMSGRGRLFAVASLLGAFLPLAVSIAWKRKTKRWASGVGAAAGVFLILVAVLFALAPSGDAAPNTRVRRVFAGNEQAYARFSLGNFLPEGDQLLLGFSVMPLIDRLLTARQASELKDLTTGVYRELENDQDFRALGSDMPDVYREMIGLARKDSHAYVYCPTATSDGAPRPVVVFFHGSGGNFKGYIWVLSKLADKLDFVLVAPSGGMGNWPAEDSTQALSDALAAASKVTAIDRTQVHLIGLSNGGLAVSRLASTTDIPLASLTLISPVFDTREINSTGFAARNHGRRISVLTGSRDDRVPPDYVEENVVRMKRAGAQVSFERVEDADHFLIFSHRAEMLVLLDRWLSASQIVQSP